MRPSLVPENSPKELIIALEDQQAHVGINLKRLILAAAPQLTIGDLPEDPQDCLWTGAVGTQVETYLEQGGTSVVEAFRNTTRSYQNYLELIAEHLKKVVRPPKTDKKDLKALIQANSKQNGNYTFPQRIGFVMDEKDIDELVTRLRTTTLSIKGFVDEVEGLDRVEARNALSERRFTHLTRSLYKVRRCAHELFQAFNSRLALTCHPSHQTMLCLDSRCGRGTKTSMTYRKAEIVRFKVLFRCENADGKNVLWQEALVIIGDEPIPPVSKTGKQNMSPTTTHQSASAATPSVTFNVTPTPATSIVGTEINNVCDAIILAQKSGQKLHLQLSQDGKLYTSSVTSQEPMVLPKSPRLIDFQNFLLDAQNRMLPQNKLSLAVKLAASILQFNETPWFGSGWRKEDLHFFQNLEVYEQVDIDHPLITKSLPTRNLVSTPIIQDDDPEGALLELGILLLEIRYHTTLEAWVQRAGLDAGKLQDATNRQILATKWYKEVKDQRADAYRDVVGICIRPQVLDKHVTSWKNDGFREGIYFYIIRPLLDDLSLLSQ